MAKQKYRNKEWLLNEFCVIGKSSKEIAKDFGVNSDAITYYLRKFGIKQKKIQRIFDNKKLCDQCNNLLELSQFKKRFGKHSFDGYWHICRKCYSKRHYETSKKYREREDVCEKQKVAVKKYQKNNREKINETKREKWKYKKNDTGVRINNLMGSRINRALNGMKSGISWKILLGYSEVDLKRHLESMFEPWMNWENWGPYSKNKKTWHIDHIRPVSSFNVTSIFCEDFLKCWSLENLRPLEAFENLSKGAKTIGVEKMSENVKLKVSRMDPLLTYSAAALAQQLAEALENAERFQKDADAFYEQAKSERQKAKKLQKLIKQVNERDKQQAQEAIEKKADAPKKTEESVPDSSDPISG